MSRSRRSAGRHAEDAASRSTPAAVTSDQVPRLRPAGGCDVDGASGGDHPGRRRPSTPPLRRRRARPPVGGAGGGAARAHGDSTQNRPPGPRRQVRADAEPGARDGGEERQRIDGASDRAGEEARVQGRSSSGALSRRPRPGRLVVLVVSTSSSGGGGGVGGGGAGGSGANGRPRRGRGDATDRKGRPLLRWRGLRGLGGRRGLGRRGRFGGRRGRLLRALGAPNNRRKSPGRFLSLSLTRALPRRDDGAGAPAAAAPARAPGVERERRRRGFAERPRRPLIPRRFHGHAGRRRRGQHQRAEVGPAQGLAHRQRPRHGALAQRPRGHLGERRSARAAPRARSPRPAWQRARTSRAETVSAGDGPSRVEHERAGLDEAGARGEIRRRGAARRLAPGTRLLGERAARGWQRAASRKRRASS